MAKYQTKQRNLLLDYFVNHTDESLSARQIADELDDEEYIIIEDLLDVDEWCGVAS